MAMVNFINGHHGSTSKLCERMYYWSLRISASKVATGIIFPHPSGANLTAKILYTTYCIPYYPTTFPTLLLSTYQKYKVF